MRLLLVLADDAQRQACADYFTLKGWDVDVAAETATAQSAVRFGAYDVIVTNSEDRETQQLTALARRRNGAVLTIVLSTDGSCDPDPSVITLTKPVPLGAMLALAAGSDRAR